MARLPGLGLARTVVALATLAAVVAVAFLLYVRPPASGADPTPSAISEGTTPTPANEPPPRTDPEPTPAAAGRGVVAVLTNPDGPPLAPDGPDGPDTEYPFIPIAYGLPTYAALWLGDNPREVHIAVTRDVEGAIAAVRDAVPRGVTVYFYVYEHTNAEVCALRDAIFRDREKLMKIGIVLNSGGCGNRENRVDIGISPFTPEVLAYMRALYEGPVDYADVGGLSLRPVDPPAPEGMRLLAHTDDGHLGLETCGRRPFPTGATNGSPAPLESDGPEFAALREALETYVDVYGDLTTLNWVLVERDDFGATFVADRGDTLLEAPVFASRDGWVPGTIAYCEPRPVTPRDGNEARLYFDPAHPLPTARSTELHALVHEMECSSGTSPASRLMPPLVRYEPGRVAVRVRIRPVAGGANCPGNPMQPVTLVLPAPVGDREIVGIANEPSR
jgi:hypothetical protein